MNVSELTATEILEPSLFDELFDETLYDAFQRERAAIELIKRAKAVGVKPDFEALYKARKAHERELKAGERRLEEQTKAAQRQAKEQERKEAMEKQKIIAEERKVRQLHAMTDFQSPDYKELFCGSWICDANGVRFFEGHGETYACYHPILPVQLLVNIETRLEKMLIAFNKDGQWKEQVFDKPTLLTASKITGALTQFGVLLSSENAKYLVRYFAEIESMNTGFIPVQKSTSKMGWVNGSGAFMPYIYDKTVVFDSESSFQGLYSSISQKGSKEKQLQLLKRLRQCPRKEPLFCIAASLASVLVKPCGSLPFIFHLYGEAGKGKTVSLMLAASLWGNPGDGGFMADPKSTKTAFEMRLNFLNNLPFICDDTAQIKRFISSQKNGDFSDFIYLVCSGKGNERSNVNLGLNSVTTWRNATITSGEKPLTTEVSQGGEILRVIEYQTKDGDIFQNARGTADFLRNNYGFVGVEFINVIQRIGEKAVNEIYSSFVEELRGMDVNGDKEGKQINSFALILTADKILTDHILKDGVYLDIADCFEMVKSTKQMSDNERAYEFILNEISMHKRKFQEGEFEPEQRWGYFREGYALINPNAFNGFCERGNFSKKLFMTWAAEKGLAKLGEGGRPDKKVKDIGRFIHVKLDGDSDKWEQVDVSELPKEFVS